MGSYEYYLIQPPCEREYDRIQQKTSLAATQLSISSFPNIDLLMALQRIILMVFSLLFVNINIIGFPFVFSLQKYDSYVIEKIMLLGVNLKSREGNSQTGHRM